MHRPRPYLAALLSVLLAACERPPPGPALPAAAVASDALGPAASRADDAAARTDAAASEAASGDAGATAPFASLELAKALPRSETDLLAAWFAAVGPRRPGEDFGALVARAALAQLGRPYRDPPAPPGPEQLTIRLEDFQCVSLVENSLAVARCVSLGAADAACFAREVEATRYRGGTMAGFASKLHYFSDWVSDNAARGRLHDLTAELGGRTTNATFDYMTRHRSHYAPLVDERVFADIQAIEAALRRRPVLSIDRALVRRAERGLRTGDVLGFVGSKPSLLVSHAALVYRDEHDVARVLHASSYHGRVIVSDGDIAEYVLRRPERLGFIAARPLAPEAPGRLPTASARRAP